MDTAKSVLEVLANQPYRFDFFQAIRLLERESQLASKSTSTQSALGTDARPADEPVRLRALQSHAFPAGAIHSFHRVGSGAGRNARRKLTKDEIVVAFMGMTGPNGVLPRHYTQLVIDRIRDKDTAMRDFFDIFNHRAISLFYRAWAKYRLPISIERNRTSSGRRDDDVIKQCFRSFTGWGQPSVRGQQHLHDDAILYYAGHFAHHPRCAISLERMIADHFKTNASVDQLVGQWLYLEVADQSRVGRARTPLSNQLGTDVVVGRRVWGVENSFKVRLGPLSYSDFQRFSPTGTKLTEIGQLIRSYVGMEFDFKVQLILRKEEVPECKLDQRSKVSPRLGWNTWVKNRPLSNDANDACFVCDGLPTAMS